MKCHMCVLGIVLVCVTSGRLIIKSHSATDYKYCSWVTIINILILNSVIQSTDTNGWWHPACQTYRTAVKTFPIQ